MTLYEARECFVYIAAVSSSVRRRRYGAVNRHQATLYTHTACNMYCCTRMIYEVPGTSTSTSSTSKYYEYCCTSFSSPLSANNIKYPGFPRSTVGDTRNQPPWTDICRSIFSVTKYGVRRTWYQIHKYQKRLNSYEVRSMYLRMYLFSILIYIVCTKYFFRKALEKFKFHKKAPDEIFQLHLGLQGHIVLLWRDQSLKTSPWDGTAAH